jgi:cyclic beta-1,2-glucan synthetase
MWPVFVWSPPRSDLPAGYACAGIWLLSPVIASSMSTETPPEKPVSGSDRAFLMREAALMWNYFDLFLTKENHYLPPDNWQEQPATGLARRTSPTNIGLGLLCVLSARDLKLIEPARAVELISLMLDSCTTGTTPRRCARSIRATLPPWTRATWRAA